MYSVLTTWVEAGTSELPVELRADVRRITRTLGAGALAGVGMVTGWSVLGAWLLAWISVSYLICTLLLRMWVRHAPHHLAGIEIGVLLVGFIHIALGATISGYELSPLTPFLIALPVVGAFGVRSNHAVFWVALGCAFVGLIFLGEAIFPFNQVVKLPPAMRASGWLLAVATTGYLAIAARRSADTLRHELAEARDEALASADARTRFLARMSHEIRTPLHGSLGLTEVLQRGELPPHQRELVDGILQSGRGLLAIVDQVLDLSKLDADRLELHTAPFDPVEVVEDVLALFAVAASLAGDRVVAVVAPGLPAQLIGDEARVRQILGNLLSNAVKFTRNGVVCVRVSHSEGVLIVTVEDTGIGIRDDELQRLFRPYRQANRETSLRYGGTGLGLSVSRRLAERMGGELVASSVVHKGSSFELRVPMAVAVPAAPGPLAGRSLCVVDSVEAPNSAVTAGRLLGMETTRVMARDLLVGGGPPEVDWVAMPSAEPDLDRIRAAVALRWPAARTLLLVPMSDPAGREDAIRRGFQASIYEPVRRAALRAVIDEAAVPPPPAATLASGLRVLVVDDNPVNRRVAELMLQHLGARTTAVESGEACVDMLRSAPFDLVLMDVLMPGISGIEATRRVRALSIRQPRIAALSASVLDEQREACFQAGADAFLRKPLSLDALASVLPGPADRDRPDGGA